MAPRPRHPAIQILRALQARRIPPEAVPRYLALAKAGQDISILNDLAVPHGAPQVAAHAWDVALAQIHSALDSIDWTNTNTERTTLIEQGDGADASALEWAQMFGPKDARAAELLASARDQRRESVRSMSDDELFRQLFPDES